MTTKLDHCNKCKHYIEEGSLCSSPDMRREKNPFKIMPKLGCSMGTPKDGSKDEPIKDCGTCGNYKGVKINCGGNKWMTPQGPTDNCAGRHWIPIPPPSTAAVEVKNCGNCNKFKGSFQECGETWERGGQTFSYSPVGTDAGPCSTGWEAKAEEKPLDKKCGNCNKFKGPRQQCGSMYIAFGGEKVPRAPIGETVGPCVSDWEAKVVEVVEKGKPGEKDCGTCSNNVGNVCQHNRKANIHVMPGMGGSCNLYTSKVAQRWVDEYKAETGISVPVKALQKDMEQTAHWNKVKQLPASKLFPGTDYGLIVAKEGAYLAYCDRDRTPVPLEIAKDLAMFPWSVPKEEHSVAKFHDFRSEKVLEEMKAVKWPFPDGRGIKRDAFSFAQKVTIKEDSYNTDFFKPETCGARGVSSEEHEVLFKNGERNLYYAPPIKKETSNMNAIIRLADSQLNKELVQFGALPIDIRTALVDLQDKAKKEAAQASAQEVMNLLTLASKKVEAKVNDIRCYRKAVETMKDDLAAIGRAKAYGLESSNFVPLAVLLGQLSASNVENKDLTKVPEDWAPATAKADASAPEDKSA